VTRVFIGISILSVTDDIHVSEDDGNGAADAVRPASCVITCGEPMASKPFINNKQIG